MEISSHHAYIYEGTTHLFNALVADARERFGFLSEHNPDVHVEVFEKFGIDEARKLRSVAALKSSSGRGLFVLGTASITTEAQQALLKLFEEPQKGLVFVVLVPHGALISTLRSRMLPYPGEVAGGEEVPVTTFLAAGGTARSAEIAKLLKDDDGARERVRGFVDALEVQLYAHLQKASIKDKKAFTESLSDIARVRDYVGDRSASLKMLLEYLALALPKL